MRRAWVLGLVICAIAVVGSIGYYVIPREINTAEQLTTVNFSTVQSSFQSSSSSSSSEAIPPEPHPINASVNLAVDYMLLCSGWSETRLHPLNPGLSLVLPNRFDWDIKWAVEHGINVFVMQIYDVSTLEPVLRQFLQARYLRYIKFAFNFVRESRFSLYQVKDYLSYLNHPQYLRTGRKPVIFYRAAYSFRRDYGDDALLEMVKDVRNQIRSAVGLDIYLVGDIVQGAETASKPPISMEAFDGVQMLFPLPTGLKTVGTVDSKGMRHYFTPYDTIISDYLEIDARWSSFAKKANKGFVPNVMANFNNTDANELSPNRYVILYHFHAVIVNATVEGFMRLLKGSLTYVTPPLRMIYIMGWSEFHERDSIAPTQEYGFIYLEAVRNVYAAVEVSATTTRT